jgi:hypothetical protein
VSLINEALKKAQRQRAAEAGTEPAGTEAEETVKARPAPRSARTVALLTLAAGLLVLGAALLTYVLTSMSSTVAPLAERPAAKPSAPARPSEPAQAAPTPPAPPLAATKAETSAPSSANTPQPTLPPTENPTAALPVASGASTPVPPATPAPPPVPATGPVPAKTNESVQAFVDTVRVTGIRAAGDDSRVLMNGRQYRLNDIVERTLGIRLIKVESNCLTFADPDGVLYLRHF